MNLKDRMNSGSPSCAKTERKLPRENEMKPNSDNTIQNSKQQSPEQILLAKQSEAIRQLTEQRDHLLQNGRSEDLKRISELTSQNSILKSKISEIQSKHQSEITLMNEELSSVQRINQSLTKNNRLLTQSNDDLRNNAGLLSKAEQSRLEEENIAIRDQNAKLKDLVDKSSADAVDAARAARDRAIRDRDNGIQEARLQATHETSQAREKQQQAENEAHRAKESLKKRSFLYISLLAFTLFCCGVTNRQVVSDFASFLETLIMGVFHMISSYIGWMKKPSYYGEFNQVLYFDTGMAWFLRIITLVAVLGIITALTIGIALLVMLYMDRWCTLSLKVMVMSLAVITIFGKSIRTVLPVNLILLFFLIQIAYLGVLWYLDGYFASRQRSATWEYIQNR